MPSTSPAITVPGSGRLPKIELTADDGARAQIYLHGAHVTSWLPAGESTDRLFVSATSRFAAGAPIRGGVPVCFPQFADQGPLPMHGLVRTVAWLLVGAEMLAGGAAQATLRHESSEATRARWPHAFALEYTVTVHARMLRLALAVTNPGSSSLTFTGALHTYLRVDDLGATRVRGLHGARYRDKFLHRDDVLETAADLRVDRPRDRVYHAAPPALEVVEPRRRTALRAERFADTVIWNPGAERGAALDDLEPDGYANMLCVEAAACRIPIIVEPGATWHGVQTLTAL